MINGLLPIGTVVLLKNTKKRLMIVGLVQRQQKDGKEIIWDYSGCLYPEGYMAPEKMFLFNNEGIERIYNLGYQDTEQFEYIKKIETVRENLKKVSAEKKENNDAAGDTTEV